MSHKILSLLIQEREGTTREKGLKLQQVMQQIINTVDDFNADSRISFNNI